jgi:hypothetical protein
VDGVLLTIRITRRTRPAAERARETLAALGANVVGVVVNDLPVAKGSGLYGYGNKYSSPGAYQYGYGYAEGYGDSGGEESGEFPQPALNGNHRPAGHLT